MWRGREEGWEVKGCGGKEGIIGEGGRRKL